MLCQRMRTVPTDQGKMTAPRRLLVTALLMSLVVPWAPLAAQAGDDDPCACPLPRDSRGGGLAGLFGLAALGLARVGAGVRSVVAEAVEQPVVALAAEDTVPPLGVAAAPIPADTTRDTTDVAVTAPAPAAPVLAMAAPRDAAPVALVAPRTATRLPLLALLALSALLTGAAMRLRKRPLVAARAAGHRRQRNSAPAVLFVRQRPRRSRVRIR